MPKINKKYHSHTLLKFSSLLHMKLNFFNIISTSLAINIICILLTIHLKKKKKKGKIRSIKIRKNEIDEVCCGYCDYFSVVAKYSKCTTMWNPSWWSFV